MYKHRIKQWINHKLLRLLVRLNSDSDLIKHCRHELRDWFAASSGDPNRWMADGTEELLAVFSSQGHSGASAPFAANLFRTMAAFKPWGPLTGEDDECNEVGPGVFQNRRVSSVFKEGGEAYWIEGRVFRDPDGSTYTSQKSRVPVTFPWAMPEHPEYVENSDE